MRRSVVAGVVLGAALAVSPPLVRAQIPPPPAASPQGVVRVAGPAAIAPVARRWARDFERTHPAIRVELNLRGSDVAMAELYTGRADVALLGRDASEPEAKAFEWIFLYPPSRMEILAGSLDQPGRAPALALVVHPDNPVRQISMAQLASVFGADPSVPDRARTWGDLGSTGAWRDRPISLYGPEAESGTGRYFRAIVLGGSNKMNWDALTEFADPVGPDADTAGRKAASAVAADPGGLGVSFASSGERVRVLALTSDAAPEAAAPTRATVSSSRYPLARRVYAYFNQRPGTERDPETDAFLKHIASAAGRAAVRPDDGYLPFTPSPDEGGGR